MKGGFTFQVTRSKIWWAKARESVRQGRSSRPQARLAVGVEEGQGLNERSQPEKLT